MSVLTVEPTFLYPSSRQFPFDEVAEEIVRAIEKRNWKVPGITIEFSTYGSGEAKYQYVQYITGDYFKLHFCRAQGCIDNTLNNIAALRSICIPKQIIEVYADESGPIYFLYVGKDWEADKEWFMNSIKVHSKLNKESRRYLLYEGISYDQRSKELIATNDLHREYSPEGDEPISFNLEEKFNEFTSYLKESVLSYILSFPEADVIQSPTKPEELIPYEGPWDTIFSICDWKAAKRIQTGKENPNDLSPSARHAYIGSGSRLVSLSVNCNDAFPKIAYEGFIWCDVNQVQDVTKKSQFVRTVKSAMSSCFGSNYIVSIKLNYANHVYVADNSKYEETREKLFESISPRTFLTDEELNTAIVARGATIVPITEYKGDYKEPIVLINRELDFEEISSISEMEE